MSTNKFSVGDKVRVIIVSSYDEELGIKIGDIHTIDSLNGSGVYINQDEIHNERWSGYLDYEQIELVNNDGIGERQMKNELFNAKVKVTQEQSIEIQELAKKYGFTDNVKIHRHPYLYLYENGLMAYGKGEEYFNQHENKLYTYEELKEKLLNGVDKILTPQEVFQAIIDEKELEYLYNDEWLSAPVGNYTWIETTLKNTFRLKPPMSIEQKRMNVIKKRLAEGKVVTAKCWDENIAQAYTLVIKSVDESSELPYIVFSSCFVNAYAIDENGNEIFE